MCVFLNFFLPQQLTGVSENVLNINSLYTKEYE
jgi:hypothetical protein